MVQVGLASGSPAERRSEPREVCFVTVMVCRHMSNLSFEPALVVDRSDHGLGLVSLQAIEPDESFLLKVTDDGVSVFVYKATRCAEMGDGRYSIGARLVRIVGQHEGS
jgi:hypothetical protein